MHFDNNISKTYLFLFLFLFLSINLSAQSIYWQKYYLGYQNYECGGNDICSLSDGSFLLIGMHSQYPSGLIIKINHYGNVLDTTYLVGYATYTCAPTNDNGCIVMGYKLNSSDEMYAAKINSNGKIVWIKEYSNTPASICFKVIRMSDNMYVACGIVSNWLGYVLKFDSNGIRIWQKTFTSGFFKAFTNISESFDNKYLLGGIIDENITKSIITKLDTSGNIIWEKYYLYNNQAINKLTINKITTNYMVSGDYYDTVQQLAKSLFFKIDSSGNMSNTYVLPYYQNYNAYHSDSKVINKNRYLFLIRKGKFDTLQTVAYITDSVGNILKSQIYDSKDYISLYKSYVLPNGYIFVGSSNHYNVNFENIFTVKTDSNLFAPSPVGIFSNNLIISNDFLAIENYPNPFNNVTKIKIIVKKAGLYDLKIYNILGKCIKIEKNIFFSEGDNYNNINLENFSSGIYFIKISNENIFKIQKIVLLK